MFRLIISIFFAILFFPTLLSASESKEVEEVEVDVTHADSIRVECPGLEDNEFMVEGVDEVVLPSTDCEWFVLKKPNLSKPEPDESGLGLTGGLILSPIGFVSNGDTQAVNTAVGGYLALSPKTTDKWGLRIETEAGFSRNTGLGLNQWAFRTFFGPEFRFGSDVLAVGVLGEIHTSSYTHDTLTGLGGGLRYYHYFDEADWGSATPFLGVRGSIQSQKYAPVWPPKLDSPPRRGAAWSVGPILGIGFR